MTHEQLIEWVAKECEEASGDLDERKSTSDKDGAVKVTKGFANALAGKAYLFAGQYDKAKAALKKSSTLENMHLFQVTNIWTTSILKVTVMRRKFSKSTLNTMLERLDGVV